MEIASNDGYMLKNFVEHGIPVLGIDPGPPQADAAIAIGVPTLKEFFDADLARRLRAEGKQADVIIANNVMAHTPTLNSFMEGLSILLADDGVATIENTYVKDLIDHCEFDTIYHEHFSYFSCTAVDALARRHGLYLNAVEHFPGAPGRHAALAPGPPRGRAAVGALVPRRRAGPGPDRLRLLPRVRRPRREDPDRPARAARGRCASRAPRSPATARRRRAARC